jgi:hypothetical protein
LKNSRKTTTPAEGADREFLGCLAPRIAAFEVLKNSRKTATPAEGADREFLGCLAPRIAAFALLRNQGPLTLRI